MGARGRPRKNISEELRQQLEEVHDVAWAKARTGAQSTEQLLDILNKLRTYYAYKLFAAVERNYLGAISEAVNQFERINRIFIDIEVHKVPTQGAIGNHIAKFPIIITAVEQEADYSDLIVAPSA